MKWENFGLEHHLVSLTDGMHLARVIRVGCCWEATLSNGMMNGRFRSLDAAKAAVENLVQLGVAHGN